MSKLPAHLNFLKRPRAIKFSFLFFFLIKKKTTFLHGDVDFFFFNNLYLLFFRKIYEILVSFQNDVFFIADMSCNSISRINDLNIFCNKKTYIYFALKNYDIVAARNLLKNKDCFLFLFVVPANRKVLYLNNESNVCSILGFDATPSFFNFFLPTLVDFYFSVYFYKYFFYSFLKTNFF